MKKILLATTTLIGAAGLFAGAALADTPKVTIGGYENFEAGYVADRIDQPATNTVLGSNKQRRDAFRSDTQIDFKIDGKTDMGLGYGGEVDLLADTSADAQRRGVNASKTVVFLDGNNWGRFEMGSEVGADGTMKVDAATIARATGGINGDWSYFANTATQYLAQAELPLAYGTLNSPNYANFTGDHSEENINKVTYYTPRFAGIQVGVSYLPDQTNRGQGQSGGFLATNTVTTPPGVDRTENNAGLASNIVTAGVNYDVKYRDIDFTVAGTGEYGKAQNSLYQNLAAWNAGAKASIAGFSVAGSYGNWGRSDTLSAARSHNTWYADLGVAYEYGPFGASLTYMYSEFNCGNQALIANNGTPNAGNTEYCQTGGKNKFNNASGGVDYKLAPGLTPYAEVTFIEENAFGRLYDQHGVVGIVGTQLNF